MSADGSIFAYCTFGNSGANCMLSSCRVTFTVAKGIHQVALNLYEREEADYRLESRTRHRKNDESGIFLWTS